MFVSKCDHCKAEYSEGQCPDWIQISGERGIMVSNANKNVRRYQVLDFCNVGCMHAFFENILKEPVDP